MKKSLLSLVGLGFLPALAISVAEREPSSISTTQAARLAELMAELTPDGTARATQTWIDAAALLLKDASAGDVEAVIRFVTEDAFWRSRVMTMPQLRARWGQLRARAEDEGALVRRTTGASWPAIEAKLRGNLARGRWPDGTPLSSEEIEEQVRYHCARFNRGGR